jgi:hypothetical protein
LDGCEQRLVPTKLVDLDDGIFSGLQADPEHAPGRSAVKVSSNRGSSQRPNTELLEELCNLAGVIGPEHLAFDDTNSSPGPTSELGLNDCFH